MYTPPGLIILRVIFLGYKKNTSPTDQWLTTPENLVTCCGSHCSFGGKMIKDLLISWANWRDESATWFGPASIKMRWVINLQKGGMIMFVPLLMWLYEVQNTNAYVYWLAHGGYGLLWLIKDCRWPDTAWQRQVSVYGATCVWLTVLGPYCLPAYWLVSSGINQALWQCLVWFTLSWFGAGLMVWADATKFVAKQCQPNQLVTSGPWRWSRHPNYWGELLCYLGLAGLSGHAASFAVIAWVWAVLMVPNLLRLRQHMRAKYPGF